MHSGEGILFSDDFDSSSLDAGRWLPHYLPHWSSRQRSGARYTLQDSFIRLFIDRDQAPWCPEFDPDVKVSGLQTGHRSGPLGSSQGQHRFRPGLVVREALPERRLFLPHYCRLAMRARAKLNPWNLAALWLIGFEDMPDRSGEITLFEAFGSNIDAAGAKIGRGIKKIHDPRLRDELDEGRLPLDVSQWHVYECEWTPRGIDFRVDGDVVTTTGQSPDYPMQLMLNFYDLSGDDRSATIEDGWFDIDSIEAWSLT